MANAKFRCLLAEADDLHDYAAAVHASMQDHLRMARRFPIDYGSVKTSILRSDLRFQVEVVTVAPNTVLPLHRHPDVDSIDIMVEGDILIDVEGVIIAGDYSCERRAAFLNGKGLRIAADALHGGVVGPQGVTFLSCQRWKMLPLPSIGLNWAGPRVTPEHDQQLRCLRGVA